MNNVLAKRGDSEVTPFFSRYQAVSHDFINALTSVRSLSELLVNNPALDDIDRIRFLNILHGETERLMRLFDRLKPSCRMESDNL